MNAGNCQQVVWLGISTEAWAIVLATAIGPVLAVLVTRWRDKIREKRDRQMRIFRTLLATRRQAITGDHVSSLNLIEIDFYGVEPIEQAWRNYHKHLNATPPDRSMTPAEQKAFEDTRNALLAKVLFTIASFLGFTMSELDLRNGGYAPSGWSFRDDRLGAIQDFVIDMSHGQRALPVFPLQSSPATQSSKP